jgi:hypothetical protein
MARKSPKKDAASDGAKVIQIEDARELVTVPLDSALWDPKRRNAITVGTGAIVRLCPPTTAADDTVRGLREAYEKAGATRVVVLPRPKAELLPEDARAVEAEEPAGAREAVAQVVAETNTKDRGALSALCEKIMSEEGL